MQNQLLTSRRNPAGSTTDFPVSNPLDRSILRTTHCCIHETTLSDLNNIGDYY